MTTKTFVDANGMHWIIVDDKTYDEFIELINRPESGSPKLAELFARPTPWDADEEED